MTPLSVGTPLIPFSTTSEVMGIGMGGGMSEDQMISNSPVLSGNSGRGKKRTSKEGKACLNCRTRKTRCKGNKPTCETCIFHNDKCEWEVEEHDHRKPHARYYVESLEKRVAILERLLKEKGHGLPSPVKEEIISEDEEGGGEDDDKRIRMNGMTSGISNLHVSEAGEELLYHGPTSAFAHSPTPTIRPQSTIQLPTSSPAYNKYLPPFPPLSPSQHNTIMDRFFRFFGSWGLRVHPQHFFEDFRTVLKDPQGTLFRYSTYSPFLHNIILAIGLMWADEPDLRTNEVRGIFAGQADMYLKGELGRPVLATVSGLALKSSYHSTLGDHTAGWSYFGMADRLSHSLGLNVDCRPLVQEGKMSVEEMERRNNTFWTLSIQEQTWSIYLGRPHAVQDYSTPFPSIDHALDKAPWVWGSLSGSSEKDLRSQDGWLHTAFVEFSKLAVIIGKVMTTLYSISTDLQKLQKDDTISQLGLTLDGWADRLPACLNIKSTSTSPTSKPDKNALPHIIMLQLAKEWITILIYRPYYKPVVPNNHPPVGPATEGFVDHAIRRCETAARRINTLLQLYHTRFNLRFTPPTLFNMAFTAGITHLLSAVRHNNRRSHNSSRQRIQVESIRAANECVQYLRCVAESWPAGGHKAEILERLIRDHEHGTEMFVQSPISPLGATLGSTFGSGIGEVIYRKGEENEVERESGLVKRRSQGKQKGRGYKVKQSEQENSRYHSNQTALVSQGESHAVPKPYQAFTIRPEPISKYGGADLDQNPEPLSFAQMLQTNDPAAYFNSGNLATPRVSMSTNSWAGTNPQQYFNFDSPAPTDDQARTLGQNAHFGDDGIPNPMYSSEDIQHFDPSFQVVGASNDAVQREPVWQPPDITNNELSNPLLTSSSASLSSSSYVSKISYIPENFDSSQSHLQPKSHTPFESGYVPINNRNQEYHPTSSSIEGMQDAEANMGFDTLYNSLIPYLTPGGPPGLFDPNQQISLASHADDCVPHDHIMQPQCQPPYHVQSQSQSQTQPTTSWDLGYTSPHHQVNTSSGFNQYSNTASSSTQSELNTAFNTFPIYRQGGHIQQSQSGMTRPLTNNDYLIMEMAENDKRANDWNSSVRQ